MENKTTIFTYVQSYIIIIMKKVCSVHKIAVLLTHRFSCESEWIEYSTQ